MSIMDEFLTETDAPVFGFVKVITRQTLVEKSMPESANSEELPVLNASSEGVVVSAVPADRKPEESEVR